MGPEQLRIAELLRRVEKRAVREVIVATNPNAEGDATAHYLAERLRPLGTRVSRIASGMPLGGDLEYADQVTIGRSLQHRRELE
jgi:recombination protein RecR